jgi:hypothetical protein
MTESDRLKRWRLILGSDAENSCAALAGDDLGMDQALEALYKSDKPVWVARHQKLRAGWGIFAPTFRVQWCG